MNKLAQIYLTTSSLDQSGLESTENLLSKTDLTKLLADLWKVKILVVLTPIFR